MPYVIRNTAGTIIGLTDDDTSSGESLSFDHPEVLYAAVARHTSNIKLRVMCAVLLASSSAVS